MTLLELVLSVRAVAFGVYVHTVCLANAVQFRGYVYVNTKKQIFIYYPYM